MASVKNSAGQFVAPSAASASAAAAKATVAADLTFSAIWAPGATSYPVTYQSWDLVNAATKKAAAVKAYISYLLGDGQKLLPELNYAPLPANIDAKAKAQLSEIK
jgi:phosphate transport system substrate-binding protein